MALAVHPWPGPLPDWDDGLVAISIVTPAGAAREIARAGIRLAVREALAQLLGARLERIAVASTPGSAPQVLVDGEPSGLGLSISHAGALSVAVLRRGGAVGIDLMEVQEVPPDWARVALDYLGKATACRLASLPPDERSRAFAQAWTEREASLKLFGLQLDEWTPLPADCKVMTLSLPPGLTGALAIQAD
jgi:4'-phosphopantetheinyl transferase